MLKLYNNEVWINFNEKSHRYYLVKDGSDLPRPKLMQGVTTVLSSLAKPMLIGWAASMAADAFCEAVWGVLKEKGTLTRTELDAMSQEARKAHTKKRDASADTGKEAHKAMEEFLKNGTEPTGLSDEAQNAYDAFKKWYENNDVEVVTSEGVVYSREYEYCGTYDLLAYVNEELTLIDFKTTNASRSAPQGVYPEYFLQLGAYASAYEEEHQRMPEKIAILSVRKDGSSDYVTNVDVGIDIKSCVMLFQSVLGLTRAMKRLDKALS